MSDKYSFDLWRKLHGLLQSFAPDLLLELRPPASREKLDQVQAILGVNFPDELRCAYLTHDGTNRNDAIRSKSKTFFPSFHQFSQLDVLLAQSQLWLNMYHQCGYDKEIDPNHPCYVACTQEMKIQPVAIWDPKWIPIGDSGSSSTIFIDLNPGPSGAHGQLLTHGGTDPPEILANGLNDYLETLCNRLENRTIFYKNGLWHWTKSNEHILRWNDLDAAW